MVATVDRLLPARLLLTSIGLGARDYDDGGWYELLTAVLEALGRQDTAPREAEDALGSIVAVALSLMRTRAPRYDRYRHHDDLDGAEDTTITRLLDVYLDGMSTPPPTSAIVNRDLDHGPAERLGSRWDPQVPAVLGEARHLERPRRMAGHLGDAPPRSPTAGSFKPRWPTRS